MLTYECEECGREKRLARPENRNLCLECGAPSSKRVVQHEFYGTRLNMTKGASCSCYRVGLPGGWRVQVEQDATEGGVGWWAAGVVFI